MIFYYSTSKAKKMFYSVHLSVNGSCFRNNNELFLHIFYCTTIILWFLFHYFHDSFIFQDSDYKFNMLRSINLFYIKNKGDKQTKRSIIKMNQICRSSCIFLFTNIYRIEKEAVYCLAAALADDISITEFVYNCLTA